MKKKKVLGIAICVIIALGVIGNMNNSGDTSKKGNTTKQEQKQESPEMQAYKTFLSIQMGSDYDTVKNALGVDGKLQHENEVAGIKTQSYEFKIGKVHATMMFQNGGLTSKAMDSLSFYKQSGEKITMDEFNQVQVGMSYDQVKGIFKRDGMLKSETSIAGGDSKLFSWINSDGSNAIITFNGNGVDSKTQTNLK